MSRAHIPPRPHDVGGQALHLRLAQHLREQLRQQGTPPGTRLASVRACAQEHGVNPQTVVAAYDLLQAQGLVEARARQGFFVRSPAHAVPGTPVEPGGPRQAREPDGAMESRLMPPIAAPIAPPTHALALLRAGLARAGQPGAARAMPGCGSLPVEWLQASPLAQALRRLLREGGTLQAAQGYGCAEGDPRLRGQLARLLAEQEVAVPASQLLLCNGATQALDLVARSLLRAGDAVMVEQPGPPLAYAQLARQGLRLLPVARGPQGPDLSRVSHWARSRKPRLMVVSSRMHNPTGGDLATGCAHQLLELAREHDFLIAEDDGYAALCDRGPALLSAMDGLRRTLLLGSLSQLLAPGWRVGFLAAPASLLQRLLETKLLAGLASPALTERALALLFERGSVPRQAAALRERLARARRQAVQAARHQGCRFELAPRGLFGWVDTGVDTERLALRLHERGWLIAPGRLFDPEARPSTRMRLNFAHAQDPAFWCEYARALRACSD